ncbi:hypothetical protein D9611_006072 [Ephemerocybe angulata]|uniref:Fungal-type protein kinase domain-containing protein n=1 Tax=Ephemerocybe angulata TaxID=980116 RepID=A0A8H5FLC0_9AGAR|nr:hypothetical protein D9611_006073 [Tulosesus angulatus]KAF5341062.1 hypothetical protein D9611_006072 [Tulosesus angulatus]
MSTSNTQSTASRVQTRSQARTEGQTALSREATRPKSRTQNPTSTKPSTLPKSTPAGASHRLPKPPQPKNKPCGNVATNTVQASKHRPFTRSVAAANQDQQGAPAECAAACPDEDPRIVKEKLADQRRAAISDLHELPTVDSACLKDLYKDVASERRIETFLRKSALYDFDRNVWLFGRSSMKATMTKIAKAVVDDLGHAKGSREVVDTRETKLAHVDDPEQFSTPDICIRASGPSFSLPRGGGATGFSNASSVFNVKRDAHVCEDDVNQLAVYNRQIFFAQLNRVFCRSLLLTKSRVRLVHSDRSGGYKTEWLDINKDPYTLVRLILGLSSPREAVLGLDTSVQWTVRNGVKVSGTITTNDASQKRVKYRLAMDEPYFVSHSVRGRGTVCWVARDKAGKRILIKDAWRTDVQVPEYTFLAQAKGLTGVAQMLSVEDDRIQTRTLRPETFDIDARDFYNRTMCRVTMACYDAPLHKFKSQRQALAAVRDAIQGHWNLLQAGILHRDVSIDNILFGPDAADPGHRGVLIDLEMAVSTGGGPTSSVLTDNPMASTQFTFQANESGTEERFLIPVAHDYLDDLESFFWILCHLIYGFDGIDHAAPDAFSHKSFLGQIDNPDTMRATNRKQIYFMKEGPAVCKPPSFWSHASVELLQRFHSYLSPIVIAKFDSRAESDDAVMETLQVLYSDVHRHYADIISLFDVALEKLAQPGGDAPYNEAPAVPQAPMTPVRPNLKRTYDNPLNAPPKRQCFGIGLPL